MSGSGIKRQFAKTLLFRSGTAGSRFFLIVYLTHLLPLEDYGFYALIVASLAICADLFEGGLTNFLRREVPNADLRTRREILTNCFSGQALLIALFLALTTAAAFFGLSLPWLTPLVGLNGIILTLLFTAAILYPTLVSYFNYVKQTEYSAQLQFLQVTLWLAIIFVLSVWQKVTLRNVLVAWLASFAVSFMLAFRRLGFIPLGRIRYGTLKKAAAFGLPLYLAGLFAVFLQYVDRYFLSTFVSIAAVGIYHFACSAISVFDRLIVSTLKIVLFPHVFQAHDQDNVHRRNFLITSLAKIHMLLAVCFLVALAASLFTYLPFILPPQYVEHKALFLLLGLVPLAIAFGYPAQLVLLLKKRTKALAIGNGVGLLTSLALNFLLIPRLAIYGASIAMIGGFLTAGAAHWLMAKVWEYFDRWHLFSLKKEIATIRYLLRLPGAVLAKGRDQTTGERGILCSREDKQEIEIVSREP